MRFFPCVAVVVGMFYYFGLAHWARADEDASAELVVTLLDEATGDGLPEGWATLFPPGERSWKTEIRPEPQRRGETVVLRAPTGEYVLVAQQRASFIDGLQYEVPGEEPRVTLAAGDRRELTLKLRARPLTPEEIDQRYPMTAVGRVTDQNGEPIAGVEVRVATGWGTLMGGGRTKTNEQGEYVLRFGAGIMIGDSESQFQAAMFFAHLKGYVEKDRSRPYKYMAYVMPKESDGYDAKPEEIVLKTSPARLDFVLTRAAVVEARVIDTGEPLAESDLVMVSPKDREGALHRIDQGDKAKNDAVGPTVWHALPDHPWRFGIGEARSVAIKFPAAGKYSVTLRYRPDGAEEIDLLEIVEARDESGRPIETTAAIDDSFALAPLEDAKSDRARKLLTRMAEANARWLRGPAPNLGKFSYRFQFVGANDRGDDVTVEPGDRAHGMHQGVSYWSALHAIADDPSLAIPRALEEGPERIKLAYTLRQPLRQGMGTGVAGSWRGYFSRPVRNATLVLDAKSLTPIVHYDDEVRESFHQFYETAAGSFVPLRIVIAVQSEPRFDWRFAWYQPGLWLLSESLNPDERKINARIENLKIDGKPAEAAAAAPSDAKE